VGRCLLPVMLAWGHRVLVVATAPRFFMRIWYVIYL